MANEASCNDWVSLSTLSGVDLCTLFGVRAPSSLSVGAKREQPLRKPVATHDRNAIHFRNAQTPANRDAAGLLHKRTFPQRHDTGRRRKAISE